jgi:O-antigen ligase
MALNSVALIHAMSFKMRTPISLGLLIFLSWVWSSPSQPLVSLYGWFFASLALSFATATFKSDVNSALFALLAWGSLFAATASLLVAGLQFFDLEALAAPWVADSPSGEAYANLRQRNQFAGLCAIAWMVLLVVMPRSNDSNAGATHIVRGLRTAVVVGASVLAGLLALGNAMSGSRTGAIQWVAVGLLVWLWRNKEHESLPLSVVFGWVVYVLWLMWMPWIAQLADNSSTGLMGRLNDHNAFSRLALWSNVLELISQQPLLGHGWRSLAYAHYSNDFSGARFMEMLDNAHNLPLHLAVELGLPVALAFSGLVLWLVWKNRPWAETRPDRQLAWGILMVIGIHSMLEYPLWYGPFFMTVVICVGILCADLWRNWLLAGTDVARSAIHLGVRCFAAALLAFTAFVAFDYHRVSQIYLQPQERSSWYAADPLGAAKKSVLFQSHAKFAELQITPLSQETAARVLQLSSELVRWSPEPRIIERLIESSVMMGLDDVAAFHLKRYKTAYPAAYLAWRKRAAE